MSVCGRSGGGELRRRKTRNRSRVLPLPVSAGCRLGAVLRVQCAVLRVRSPVYHHHSGHPRRRPLCRSGVPAAAKPRPHFRSGDQRGAAVKRVRKRSGRSLHI